MNQQGECGLSPLLPFFRSVFGNELNVFFEGVSGNVMASYNMMRSILSAYSVSSEEDIEKVIDRFKEYKRLENDFNERLNVLNKQYIMLKH